MCYKKTIRQSQALRTEVDTLRHADAEQFEKPMVVVWGLMNSGKSYLLNMLTHHIEQEYFKVNDFRETIENKVFESIKCCYVDTPGLDANAEDNAEALKGVESADVILFVHQLQGELEAVEIEFLKKIQDTYGDCADDNIVIVLSKVDKEPYEKVFEIQDMILRQCKEILKFEPKCFQVSNTRYKKGKKTNKGALIRKSHIDELKEYIEQRIASVSEVRAQKSYFVQKQLLNRLITQKKLLEQEKYQKKVEIEVATKELKLFTEDMQSLIKFIDSKVIDYQNV